MTPTGPSPVADPPTQALPRPEGAPLPDLLPWAPELTGEVHTAMRAYAPRSSLAVKLLLALRQLLAQPARQPAQE